MLKKNVAFLLAVLTLCGTAACSSGGNKESGTAQTAADTATAAAETESVLVKDNLPAIDMGGAKITFLVREEEKGEFFAEASGDIIDDEVYKRNLKTEERFKCTMDYSIHPGAWASQATYKELIRSAVTAGDDCYTAVTGQSNIVQPLNVEGMYINLLDSQYLDLEQPYWLASYTEGMNLNGEVCTVCGDISLTTFSDANVIFFNKKVIEDNNLPYPYENVLDGTWTLDYFLGLCETVSKDLNGDGTLDIADRIGYCAESNFVQPFFSSCGFHYTDVDKSTGQMVLLQPSESLIATADKMNEFCHGKFFTQPSAYEKASDKMGDAFMGNRLLFLGLMLGNIKSFREMEVDFGILPFPKLNEEQDFYRTTILRKYTVTAIPKSSGAPEYAAAVMESMACDGCNYIIPTYYEIALTGKYFRDEDSREMLDIIKDSLYLEFVDLYYNDVKTFSDFFANYVLGSGYGTFMSTFKSREPSIVECLKNLYK